MYIRRIGSNWFVAWTMWCVKPKLGWWFRKWLFREGWDRILLCDSDNFWTFKRYRRNKCWRMFVADIEYVNMTKILKLSGFHSRLDPLAKRWNYTRDHQGGYCTLNGSMGFAKAGRMSPFDLNCLSSVSVHYCHTLQQSDMTILHRGVQYPSYKPPFIGIFQLATFDCQKLFSLTIFVSYSWDAIILFNELV